MQQNAMIDKKPYMLRAAYQWVVDNGWTPHLIVACPNVGWVSGLSEDFLQDEFLILNISPSAAPDCLIENDYVFFSGRFKGESCQVSVAMQAVAALIARENGQGFNFELPEDIKEGPKKTKEKVEVEKRDASVKQSKPSHLKIVR